MNECRGGKVFGWEKGSARSWPVRSPDTRVNADRGPRGREYWLIE